MDEEFLRTDSNLQDSHAQQNERNQYCPNPSAMRKNELGQG